MKKLLALLGAVSLSASVAVSVVACSTNNRKAVEIKQIEKNLLFLLQTKENKDEPWTKDELEAAIVDKKIEKSGGISVEVSEPISPGSITEYEQVIVFKGNATNKNDFIYSGQVAITYAYGENLPPDKVTITKESVEQSLQSLTEFLAGTVFVNKGLVRNSFKSGANISGAPVEGLRFGEVENLAFHETQSENTKERPILTFTFSANVELKDNNVYQFEEGFDNTAFHEFEGKVWEPIKISDTKVSELTTKIQKQAIKWDFFNQKSFSEQVKTKIEEITLSEGILYDSFAVESISADNETNQKAWVANIRITLIPDSVLGYELENGQESFDINILTNFFSLMNVDKSTMDWNIFEKEEKMLIAPQFIQFGGKEDINRIVQGEHLIEEKLTAKWGNKPDTEGDQKTDDPWVNEGMVNSAYEAKLSLALKILETQEGDDKTKKFIDDYLTNTTSFNYAENDNNTFSNDQALFIRETDKGWEEKLKGKLATTGTLEELQEDTINFGNETLQKAEYFHVVFLTKNAESPEIYHTSSKAFRVRLNPVKI